MGTNAPTTKARQQGRKTEVIEQHPASTANLSNHQLLRGWRVDACLGVEMLWNAASQEARA